MEKILPYYEQELAFIRNDLRAFAERFPKLAGALLITGDTSADPAIERLIQANALSNARTGMQLDDTYSQFTEALLAMVSPHYLRPIPSYAIARLDYSEAKPNALGARTTIARGTELKSVVSGVQTCKFRTVFDLHLAGIAVTQVRFSPFIQAPPALRLPPGVSSCISIELSSTSSSHALDQLDLPSLRLFLDGDASLRACLRDTLFMRAVGAYVECEGESEWITLPSIPLGAVGFTMADAMLPGDGWEHPTYRLLTEYFFYPEKFNFVDIQLKTILQACAPRCRRLTLHLALSELRDDSSAMRILASLNAHHLLPGCAPVINLFRHPATPIRLTHQRSAYPVLPDDMPAQACDIYSIDSVQLLRKAGNSGTTIPFMPFYAMRHGQHAAQKGHYWLSRRDRALELSGAAHDHLLTFVDRDFTPMHSEHGTASISLTCTNRDLPVRLRYGLPGGDLSVERGAGAYPIRLLRKPTANHCLAAGRGTHWGLVAHLALNQRTLAADNGGALAAVLRLYAPAASAVAQHQIDAIAGVSQRPTSAWLRDAHGAALVNGVEFCITLDEEAFAGSGLHAFIQMLDHFLGLSVHLNSFTQLLVVSKLSGKELFKCPPRNGLLTLA